MIYPNNYEHKIGFDEIRTLLRDRCLSSLGREKVGELDFSDDVQEVNERLCQVREFRQLTETKDDFPLQYFFDVREAVARIRLAGTHFEEQEVYDLRRSLETIHKIVSYLTPKDADDEGGDDVPYPALHRLTEGVVTFPAMIRRIDSILDKFGKIKDGASMTLAGIRHELAQLCRPMSSEGHHRLAGSPETDCEPSAERRGNPLPSLSVSGLSLLCRIQAEHAERRLILSRLQRRFRNLTIPINRREPKRAA